MSLPNVDITDGLNSIMLFLMRIFIFVYDFMRGIKFMGTNLFSFTVTIFLLIIILPILFTLVRSEAINNQRFKERVNKMRNRRKGE